MISDEGPFLGDPDEDGWHDGTDHGLVAWDDTHVAAIFSDASVSSWGGGSVRMITMDPYTGAVTLGPKTTYYNELPVEFGGPGDPEGTFTVLDEQKVGNLLVQQRRDTGRLFTFTYDEATNTFTKETPQYIDWGGSFDSDGNRGQYGARMVPWTNDTMLMVRNVYVGSPATYHLLARFAKWNGTVWDFGAISEVEGSFGNNDYTDVVPIVDQGSDGAPTALARYHSQEDYWTWKYATINGAYPEPPTIVKTDQVCTGMLDYFPFQWFAVSPWWQRHMLAAVPVEPGTLTPVYGGSDLFDWAVMKVSLNQGVVTESELMSIGPTDDWYDICLTETADGHVWATWTLPGTQGGSGGRIGIRDVTADTEIVIDDPYDDGLSTSDYYTRTIAAAGNRVVTTWMTRYNNKLPVTSYGFYEIPPFLTPGLAADLRLIGQRFM